MIFKIALDPPAVIPGRTELSLSSAGIACDVAGIDWGESAIKAFLSEQLYGESPADHRVPNRIVTLPLATGIEVEGEVAEEEVRRKLQTKVALLQRQGGILLRQREGGQPLYADIVNASLIVPDKYGEVGGVEPGVTLKLECLPDFYGNEIELDALTGTGQVIGVLKKAGATATIAGDYPARTRIVATDTSGQHQRTVLWGLRSTNYTNAARAALFFDAKDMTPINNATVVTQAGTYSGSWIRLATPNVILGQWHPFMTTDLAAGQLTHTGSYRVWARVNGWTGGLVRLAWSLDDATAPILNPPAVVPVQGGSVFCLLDLGEVRLEEAPIGEHWWRGIIQGNSNGTPGDVGVDRIWFQPVDDGAGRLLATGDVGSPFYLTTGKPPTKVKQIETGVEWLNQNGILTPGANSRVENIGVGGRTKGLVVETAGFALPSIATIVGIEIESKFVSFSGSGGSNGSGGTLTMQLIKGGVVVGTARAAPVNGAFSWSGTLGGPNDLWGLSSITPAELNSATFGFSFVAGVVGAPEKGVSIGGVPTIKIHYYTSSTAVPLDAALYASRKSEIRTEGAFREDTATVSYVPVSTVLGALPRLPPSGLEQRPVELQVKPSRGLLGTEADAGKDNLSAQVFYRPCYIGRI